MKLRVTEHQPLRHVMQCATRRCRAAGLRHVRAASNPLKRLGRRKRADVESATMTLSFAWVRDVATVRELVIATDSRLRAPFTWDCCPKILPLPRNDSAVCFAGATYLAYPIMLQMQHVLRLHPKTLSRATDLYDLKGYILQVMNGMRRQMHELPSDPSAVGEEHTFFILAGYSWRRADFAIWTLHFDKSIDAFTFRPATPWPGVEGHRLLAVVGDRVPEAKTRLAEVLRSVGKRTSGGLDMEPLAVLRDMIRGGVDPSIGDAPQVVKVYKHMNVVTFGVFWPNREARNVTVLGRELLPFEELNTGVIDPDTFNVEIVPAQAASATERGNV